MARADHPDNELRSPRPAPAGRRHAGGRRALRVAGVSGGVGTTTLAVALRGIDRGLVVRYPTADVLVCQATGESLVRAAGMAHSIAAGSGPPPVLAVTVLDRRTPGRAVTARIRLLEPHVRAVVLVPHVRRWRQITSPLDELRTALAPSAASLPRHLRPYVAAVGEIASAAGAAASSRSGAGSTAHSAYRPVIRISTALRSSL